MLKHKALVMVSILVLVLAVVAMSCAPAKPATPPAPVTPPVVTPPPTPPAPPATPTTPAVTPPTTPPAAPVVVPIKTSFEAETYTNSEPAFSLMYPKTWTKKSATAPAVLAAAADGGQTAPAISVVVINKAADFAAEAKNQLDSSATFKQYSVSAKIDSSKAATLADGKTTASEVELSAKIVIYDAYIYVFGTDIGDKTIMVIANTVNKDQNKALLQEIAKTLSVK